MEIRPPDSGCWSTLSGGLERRSEWMSFGMQRNNLIGSKRVQTIGVTRRVHELNLERIGGENLDHRANLACNQAQLGQIANKSDSVEQMDG